MLAPPTLIDAESTTVIDGDVTNTEQFEVVIEKRGKSNVICTGVDNNVCTCS